MRMDRRVIFDVHVYKKRADTVSSYVLDPNISSVFFL